MDFFKMPFETWNVPRTTFSEIENPDSQCHDTSGFTPSSHLFQNDGFYSKLIITAFWAYTRTILSAQTVGWSASILKALGKKRAEYREEQKALNPYKYFGLQLHCSRKWFFTKN